ncbi:IS3 family transposase [Dokdonella sp.]|uniref:IS3 family transposase n=1 Tax=Dokdonella sp. TaxID=2291710 RepID=UPI0032C22CA1
MQAHLDEFRVTRMCRVLGVQRSGFYAWRQRPHSERHREDQRLLGMIKQVWLESGTVYGYRKVTDDLRDLGERCGKHRVARLMKSEGLRAQVGYGRRPRPRAGRVSMVAPNHLDRQFDVAAPIRTGSPTSPISARTRAGYTWRWCWICTRARSVGWAMQGQMHADLVLQALLAAVWRRKPATGLMLHSDQGSQFTGAQWQAFLKAHGIVCSMSRRGNCHDNAVAESFFQLLKRERIKRRTYLTRDAARSDVFDYIEMFYNPKCRHGSNGGVSPVGFNRQAGLSGS